MSSLIVRDNIRIVLKFLLKKLNCHFSQEIYQNMVDHPDFPSFLSFQHILKLEGIECLALKATLNQIKNDLPKPVLVHVTTNVDLFLLVESVDNKGVYILNEYGKAEYEPIDGFLRMWDGNAMIFDRENIKKKPISFHQNISDFLSFIKKPFIYSTILITLLTILLNSIEQRNLFNYMYLAFSCVGLLFSVLLFIESFDKNNPLIRQICTSKKNRKVDCSSILNSKDAYLFGFFSWSDIGIVFFAFIFLLNLVNVNSISSSISCILSMLALPYTFYSITYQKFVARSWCRLCLGVQGAILTLFILSLFTYESANFNSLKQPHYILPVTLLGLIIISALLLIKPLLNSLYVVKDIKPKYIQLKHSPEIMQVLFSKQQTINSASNCALTLGNTNGENTLTLVVSPMCSPCMNELSVLIPILRRKENTCIELLLLVDMAEDILSVTLAEALFEKYLSNKVDFMKTLEDYVNSYPKSKFSYSKRALDFTSEKTRQILKKQQFWGKENRVLSTPQFFLNQQRIPEFYTAKDIDYMLT